MSQLSQKMTQSASCCHEALSAWAGISLPIVLALRGCVSACAAGYNGPFYTQGGVELGQFQGGVPRIQNTQIIQQNNINININAPARQIETPTAAGKQPISTAVGKEGERLAFCYLSWSMHLCCGCKST